MMISGEKIKKNRVSGMKKKANRTRKEKGGTTLFVDVSALCGS